MADTINTLLTGIENSKGDIATSIEGKGVSVPSGTKLAGMSSLIDQISTMHGPASSTDGNLAAFDGTSGDTLKDSGIAASTIALDADVVHKGTNSSSITETIYGEKKFGSTVRFGAYSAGAMGFLSEGSISSSSLLSMNIDAIRSLNLSANGYSGTATSGFSFKDYYKPTGSSTTYTNTYKFPNKIAETVTYTIATTNDIPEVVDVSTRIDCGVLGDNVESAWWTVEKFDLLYNGTSAAVTSSIADIKSSIMTRETYNGYPALNFNISGPSAIVYKNNNKIYGYSAASSSNFYIYRYGTDASIYNTLLGTNLSQAVPTASSIPIKYIKDATSGSNYSSTSFYDQDDRHLVTSYNFYPTRLYTSGLQISNYTGNTGCALYVPYATYTQAGVVTTDNQTWKGMKTFYSGGVEFTNASYTIPPISLQSTESNVLKVNFASANPDSSVLLRSSGNSATDNTTKFINGVIDKKIELVGFESGSSGTSWSSYLQFPKNKGTSSDYKTLATTDDIPSVTNFVTISGDAQTISSQKTFTGKTTLGPSTPSSATAVADIGKTSSYGGGFTFYSGSTSQAGYLIGYFNGSSSSYPYISNIQKVVFHQGYGGTHAPDTYSTTLISSSQPTANVTLTLPNTSGTLGFAIDVVDLR